MNKSILEKKHLSKVLNIILILFTIYVIIKQVPTVLNSYSQQGKALNSTQVFTLEGHPQKFPLSGRKVYLFWATWCPPCHLQMEMFQSSVDSKDIQPEDIVAVSLGEPIEVVKQHIEKNKFSFTVFANPTGEAWKIYNVQATPSIAFVNEMGTIEYFTAGFSPTAPFRAKNFLKSSSSN